MTDKISEVARAICDNRAYSGRFDQLNKYRRNRWRRTAKAAIEAMPWQELEEEQPEKWSFDTLMLAADRILSGRYPETVFTGVSGDCGARLVVALRDCRSALEGKDADES